MWPELHSLLFNVVEGKSEEWGVRDASRCPQNRTEAYSTDLAVAYLLYLDAAKTHAARISARIAWQHHAQQRSAAVSAHLRIHYRHELPQAQRVAIYRLYDTLPQRFGHRWHPLCVRTVAMSDHPWY